MDGADLQGAGPDCRRDRACPGRRAAPRGLRRRHHLRHEQRIRLRLFARQHEVRFGAVRAARAPLRGRRRSRFDPDRRSAHTADYFRTVGRSGRQVLPHRQNYSEIDSGDRLHGRRKAAHRDADRRRREQVRALTGPAEPLRSAAHRDHSSRLSGIARAHAL